MIKNKMTVYQLNELEKTHLALETFVVQLEATIKIAKAGNVEHCVEALRHLHGNAKQILDGDEPIGVDTQETVLILN